MLLVVRCLGCVMSVVCFLLPLGGVDLVCAVCCCLMFVVCSVLVGVCLISVDVIRALCSLLVVRRSFHVVRCPLFVACGVWFAGRCLLSVGCRCRALFVACC